ncbi:MAG TPA: VCBS repeat-containing protein [bacterium]|nr:VCBS repeat-containing protein [bacterium]HQP97915.1 VCBS repeat-containing protein [bacterium]
MAIGSLSFAQEPALVVVSERYPGAASYLGKGDGSFQQIPVPEPSGRYADIAFLASDWIALADANADRVLLSHHDKSKGWGMENRQIAVDFPTWVFGGDLEPDGKPDLIVVSQITWIMTAIPDVLGDSPRQIDFELPYRPVCVTVAGSDSHPGDEVLVSFGVPAEIRIYSLGESGFLEKNRVDPTSGLGPGAHVTDFIVADTDGDPYTDIAAVNFFGCVQIFHGSGDGAFQRMEQASVPALPRQIGVGDMDGDGIEDLVVTSIGIGATGRDEILILRQDPWTGLLPPEQVGEVPDPAALEVLDLDHDKRPDLVALSRESGEIRVFLNRTLPPTTHPPIVGKIPDLRLLKGESLINAFDLDNYVVDPDTPRNRLHWSVRSWGNCPKITIHPDEVVNLDAPVESGKTGYAQFIVTDGRHRVARTIRIHVFDSVSGRE